MSESKTRPVLATAGAFLALAGVGAGSALALHLAGVPMLPKPQEVEAAPVKPVDTRSVLKLKKSPAVVLIDKVMAGDKALQASGQVKNGGTPAIPFSCPAGSYNPVYSASRSFAYDGERIQAVVSAYTAGYGATAFNAHRHGARSCASGLGSYSGWNESVKGFEGFSADLRQSKSTSRTMMVRYGDLLVHVQGAPSKVKAAAGHIVGLLSASDVCKSSAQGVSAFKRNPLAGNDFEGRFIDETVTVDEPKLPKVPDDAGYEPVQEDEIPGQPAKVFPASTPGYEVFPEMPSEVKYPVRPTAPDAPELKSVVQILAEDRTGPGCGWDFTGSPGPVWDAQAALRDNTKVIDEASGKLHDGVSQWEKSMLAYWQDATDYIGAVEKYEQYSKQVTEVNAAWARIGEQWSIYERELSAWQAREDQIVQFHADKDAAAKRYQDALQACEAQRQEQDEEDAEALVQPDDEQNADSQENPEQEVQTQEPVVQEPCVDTVGKPEILNASAPEPLVRPEPPASPRP